MKKVTTLEHKTKKKKKYMYINQTKTTTNPEKKYISGKRKTQLCVIIRVDHGLSKRYEDWLWQKLIENMSARGMVNGKNLADTVRPIEGQVRNLKLHPSSPLIWIY